MPSYLSPTSIKLFMESPDAFYARYMTKTKSFREPQTKPMSIGSAFDAYAKSELYQTLFGKRDPRFEFQTLFEAQVEEHNRDWAEINGFSAFKQYKDSGAYADLLLALQAASSEPRFEIDVQGKITDLDVGIEGVPMLGKPDVYFVSKDGHSVILDWKVNGWCGKSATSPKPGYYACREAGKTVSRHKNCVPKYHKGWWINAAHPLEIVDKDWAVQLAIYSWLCGEPIGSDFIVGIDQLACSPNGDFPRVRVAEHRCLISRDFQIMIARIAHDIWSRVESDHFFKELPKEESDLKCKLLEDMASVSHDPEFREMMNG